ncbi:MAG: DUF2177 family protein [Paracoccaceae bacterium]|jgi:uncharacterized membrane protein|tara:strand:+ start:52 stop:465 length:414 start_codon:yes stop_codon:yes gene_type:complete
MKTFLISYLTTTVIFLLIDIVWLSQAVPYFYQPNIGDLLREDPIILIAALFYLIYPIGVNILVVIPALEGRFIKKVFFNGFIFGFVAYGTYNLTNMATLTGWSIHVVLVDMLWGGILTASSATFAVYYTRKLLKIKY